jgi:hypothetical protein
MTTLATLRTRAQYVADMTNSQFIADAELNQYINTGLAELYDLVVSSFEDYFTVSTFLTITAGTNTVELPATFYKARAVDFSLNGTWSTVKLFNFLSRNSLRKTSFLQNVPDSGRRYRIFGDTLFIQNTDDAAGTYRLWYVPAYTALVADGDTIPVSLSKFGWDEYIVLYAAERMLSKEESSIVDVRNRRDEIRDRIIQMASDRQIEQAESVSDVTGNQLKGWDFEY